MRINSIQTNLNTKYSRPISFTSTSSNEAVLSIQNPDTTQFKRNMQRTIDADAVLTNPIKAFVGKLGKTMDVLFKPKFDNGNTYTDPNIDRLVDIRRYYL